MHDRPYSLAGAVTLRLTPMWFTAAACLLSAGAHAQAPELTVDTLIRLRQAEMQQEVQQRLKRLAPPPAAPAPAAAASAPVLKLPLMQEPPPPTKRVAAIYGRSGSETADIELSSGEVRKVAAGAVVEGWRVMSIDPGGVEVRGVLKPSRSAKPSTTSGPAKAQARGEAPRPVTLRVPLGGTFE